jgi:hypothetical protein
MMITQPCSPSHIFVIMLARIGLELLHHLILILCNQSHIIVVMLTQVGLRFLHHFILVLYQICSSFFFKKIIL